MLNNSLIREISVSVQSKQKLAANDRDSVEEQAKQDRARAIEFSNLLWAVQNCEPGTSDKKSGTRITPATLSSVMAGRLLSLARFMDAHGLLDRLDRLPVDTEAAQFLAELMRSSVQATQADIADELEQVKGPGGFTEDLNFLLHGHLRKLIYPDEWPPREQPVSKALYRVEPAVEEVSIGAMLPWLQLLSEAEAIPQEYEDTPSPPGTEDRALQDDSTQTLQLSASEDSVRAAAAFQYDPDDPGAEKAPRCKATTRNRADFAHWAFGMEAENSWHLFRRVIENGRPHWRHQKKVVGVSRGKLQRIMEKLAEGSGFVSRKVLAALLCKGLLPSKSKYKGQLMSPLSRLRNVIRTNINDSSPQGDPLLWDKSREGWKAECEIGYAVMDNSRLEYRSHEQMQP